jgi:hypothetical protein
MGLTLPTGTPKGVLEFSLRNSQASFIFLAFEVPSHLDSLGVDEISVMHQFPGGRRVIQTFGEVPPKEIRWDGIIFGPDSFSRVEQLRGMVSSNTCTLTYGPYRFQGILKSVLPKPGYEGQIPYSALFEPTVELSTTALPSLSAGPVTQLQAILAAIGQTQDAVAQMQETVSGYTTQAAVAAAYMVSLGVAIQDTVQNIDTGNPTASITELAFNNAALFTYLGSTTNQDNAQLAIALWIQSNALLTALSFIAPTNTLYLTIDSPNLFTLAATYYGDPGQWTQISSDNGNLPIFNQGTMTLAIRV